MARIRPLQALKSLWFVPIAGGLLACSSQVESDHRGEPVVTLRGTVTAQAAIESSEHVSAALVWAIGVSTSGPRGGVA